MSGPLTGIRLNRLDDQGRRRLLAAAVFVRNAQKSTPRLEGKSKIARSDMAAATGWKGLRRVCQDVANGGRARKLQRGSHPDRSFALALLIRRELSRPEAAVRSTRRGYAQDRIPRRLQMTLHACSNSRRGLRGQSFWASPYPMLTRKSDVHRPSGKKSVSSVA